ncbi:hypothetical protein NXV13_10545 [Bacteroides ovatus]|nr:hypothetical protein [Bacteroides ovatus]
MTSQLTEGFMQAYEVLEPSIRTVLRTFLAKFKAPEFTRGTGVHRECLVGHLHRDRQYRRMGDPQFPLDRTACLYRRCRDPAVQGGGSPDEYRHRHGVYRQTVCAHDINQCRAGAAGGGWYR